MEGEGVKPIFDFLTPISRRVVFKGNPSEVKSSTDDDLSRLLQSPKPNEVSHRHDSRSSPPHGNYAISHHRSRSSEHMSVHVKQEWERVREMNRDKYHERDREKNRDHDPDRPHERNGERDVRRGDGTMQHSRRTVQDRDRAKHEVESARSRDREREREEDRDREREREREHERERERARERGRERNYDRVKDRERARNKNGERDGERDLTKEPEHERSSRCKSETRVKSEPGTSEETGDRRSGSVQPYVRQPPPFMDLRIRGLGPGYGPMRFPPPFMGPRPFGPYGPMPPRPPPMYFPPRIPRPKLCLQAGTDRQRR